MDHLPLSADQIEARDKLIGANVAGLIGNAGTGKTTTAHAVVANLPRPILTAPTHKAANVLRQKTGREVTTIHSLLKLVPVPDGEGGRVLRQQGDPEIAPGSTIVIDEASMLDPYMLSMLDEEIANGVGVLLIGDASQLPPVGYTGAVFMEWLDRHGAPVGELTKIHRQAEDSPLPHLAAGWRLGVNTAPQWPREDVIGRSGGVMRVSREAAMDAFVADAVAHAAAGLPSDQVRPWLGYTNRAVNHAGQRARQAIYGGDAAIPFLEDEPLVVGSAYVEDGVIRLPISTVVRVVSDPMLNNLDLAGERWTVYSMDVAPEDKPHQVMSVHAMPYADRSAMLGTLAGIAKGTIGERARKAAWDEFYDWENAILDLRTIFASTIHKSQGSTFPDVYIDMIDLQNTNAAPILRSLGYVALTRPSSYAKLAA